jgi:hypothetical protein
VSGTKFSIRQHIRLRHNLSDELEAILQQKSQGSDHGSNSPPQYDSWSQSLYRQSQSAQASSSSLSQILPDVSNQNDVKNFSIFPHCSQISEILPTATSTSGVDITSFNDQFETTFDLLPRVDNSEDDQAFPFIGQIEQDTTEVPRHSPEPEMMWPQNLPPPGLLRHLCALRHLAVLLVSPLHLSDSLPVSRCFLRSNHTLVAYFMLPASWSHCHFLRRIQNFP